ncbi:hypothetical protein [Methylomicrobium sp. Wu6]|uniref:hypothetical protein n=1 Tax=Methylomicrobium sp. Wu6 TaxID=3107928 RepID=UPI002DD61DD0|nr:hypothetical protein [Methylomicrobium sp. Wu6]MEC4748137.1 hypothetical protein [Methylomicrobium sp. Wu6]
MNDKGCCRGSSLMNNKLGKTFSGNYESPSQTDADTPVITVAPNHRLLEKLKSDMH